MKLSEKQFQNIQKQFQKSCFLDGYLIRTYGEICALEGKKSEAKKYLKGQQKVIRLQEINKQLKEIQSKVLLND